MTRPARRRSFLPSDVAVLSTAHDFRDARLHRIVTALRRQSLSVAVAAVTDGESTAGAGIELRRRGSLGTRLRRAWNLPRHCHARVMLILDPDLIIPAYLWARLRRQKLVVDVHEDYRAVLADRPWITPIHRPAIRLALAGTYQVAARADLLAVADADLPPTVADHRIVVRNLPLQGELPDAGTPGPEPRAIYVGDLRGSRGLFTMLDAVAEAPRWRLSLVGPLSGITPPELRHHLDARELRDRVTWYGRRPLREAWSLARGAWLGLCLLDQTPAFEAALPSKVWEYLAVGLPVLSSPLPRVAELLTTASAGTIVQDAKATARHLNRWADQPYLLHDQRREARAFAHSQLPELRSPFDELAVAVAKVVDHHSGR